MSIIKYRPAYFNLVTNRTSSLNLSTFIDKIESQAMNLSEALKADKTLTAKDSLYLTSLSTEFCNYLRLKLARRPTKTTMKYSLDLKNIDVTYNTYIEHNDNVFLNIKLHDKVCIKLFKNFINQEIITNIAQDTYLYQFIQNIKIMNFKFTAVLATQYNISHNSLLKSKEYTTSYDSITSVISEKWSDTLFNLVGYPINKYN
jgi:hypothetical protein